MPLNKDIRRTLVIGSGPIVIGQAAEFDYAGTQACEVLKDAGVEVVLVNSNPATIMTDGHMADHVYIEPLTLPTLRRIIEKEQPDSILPTLGGQTGLTLAMQLAKEGFLEEHGVKLLGAKPDTIDRAEDRQRFKDTMEAIGQPVIPSVVTESLEGALAFASEIGYPLIVRPAFTLGGSGGGIAADEAELREIAERGLRMSPIRQILVEQCIAGWKEIEFEVMRDSAGNCITICSMENFDPVGVHTGDSIVIAPAVTLADKEYQMLRSAALRIIDSLGIEGGCNCQFALNPESFEYAVIEVNPRVSRSSALASKATGYLFRRHRNRSGKNQPLFCGKIRQKRRNFSAISFLLQTRKHSRVRLIASMRRILREINRKDRFRRSLKAALFSIYPTKKHFSARMRRLPRGNSFLLPANGEVRIRDSYPTRSPRLYPLCRKD